MNHEITVSTVSDARTLSGGSTVSGTSTTAAPAGGSAATSLPATDRGLEAAAAGALSRGGANDGHS
jgi:hypothetical protein